MPLGKSTPIAARAELRRNSVVDARRAYLSNVRAASVGNNLMLEVAKPAGLLSRLVLYASIYMLLRLAISLAVLRSSLTPSATSRFSPSATRSPFCVVRSSGRICCPPTG